MLSWMGLLEASVAGGICIVLCLLVSMLCGGRYRAKYKKIVWLLIALRLCIPVSLPVFPQLFTVQLPVYALEVRESKPVIGDNSTTNDSLYLKGKGVIASDQGKDIRVFDVLLVGENAEINIGNRLNLGEIFAVIWVCGSFIVLLYYLIGNSMFRHSMMRRSEICRNEKINEAVSEKAAWLKLKRVPQVRIANKMQTGPFTIGFFRNIIVLPDADYEEKHLHYVLSHEIVHCASRDALLKVIFILANIIHWFNPLVWLMKTLADQDMELACDEKVLAASTGDERKEYSNVLMSYVTAGVPGKSVLFSGCSHDIKFLKKRFKSIYNTHKKSGKVIGGILVIFLMLISGLFGFETGQTVQAQENEVMDFDSFEVSVSDLRGYGDFSNTGIFQGMLNAFFNGDSYSSTDTNEYLQFDGFKGKSFLNIFPKTIEGAEVIDYSYQYMNTLFDPTARIYLECRYDEEAYQAEIARLQGIKAEHEGKVQTVIYDTENFNYPAYVTINGNDHCYEYVLLLGEGRIAYIHMEFIKEEEVAFSADYLPKTYEEGDKGYSMYIFYQKDGSGYYATPSEE